MGVTVTERHRPATRRDERVIGGSFIAGAIETVKSPLMRRFALLMLLGDAVGTVIYALLADYSGATYSTREARTDFAASIDLGANVLQALLQVTVTRALMVRFGSAPTTSLYDCRSNSSTASETCTLTVPAGQSNAYIMVRGAGSGTASYTLTINYTRP